MKVAMIQNQKKLENVERKIKKSEWLQKQSAMREQRRQERKAWIEGIDINKPKETAESFFNIFKSHPLQATMREKELIPEFKPQHSD